MILSVTLNPSVDQQVFVDRLRPNDTNRVLRTEIDAGGKGINLSRVYAELGGRTVATGFIGGASGMFVLDVLRRQGATCDFVSIANSTRTNFSVEDASEAPPTTFNDRGPEISEMAFEELVEKVDRWSKEAKWVCLGGSLPPGISVEAYRKLGYLAKDRGCKLLLDADKEPSIEGMKAFPDFIKPNSREAGRLLGRDIVTDDDAIGAAQELRDRLEVGCKSPIVVVSRGELGAILACDAGVFLGRSVPIQAKSTIGSGDSFLAGMLWAMVELEDPMEVAFRWGLAAGAATATTDGTEIAHRGVVEILFGHTSVERIE